MHHAHAGVFKPSFVIPNVAPGSYTIGFWCIPCAPPKGATFTGAYPGRVPTGGRFTKILRVTAAQKKAVDSLSRRAGGATTAIKAAMGLAVALSALTIVRLYIRRSRAGTRRSGGG
jgi:hypothetical protein